MVAVKDVCRHYKVKRSFIRSLQDYNLLEVSIIDDEHFIHHDQLQLLEKLSRLHFDLNINLEGIDAIFHLLQKIEFMHNETQRLQNKLQQFMEGE
jgi:hypothetical protein